MLFALMNLGPWNYGQRTAYVGLGKAILNVSVRLILAKQAPNSSWHSMMSMMMSLPGLCTRGKQVKIFSKPGSAFDTAILLMKKYS